MQRPLLLVLALGILLPSAVTLRANSHFRAGIRAHTRGPYPRTRPGEVVVQFAAGATEGGIVAALKALPAKRVVKSPFGESYVATLPGDASVGAAIARLKSLPEVDYAEPNYIAHADFTPNDPLFAYQWNFAANQVNAPLTWAIQEGSSDVVVAVVDTGIAYEDYGAFRKGPDWGGTTFVQGYNFVEGTPHANDDEGHGTHVASTIAETTDNAFGAAGLAFKCALMPVKVLDSSGEGTLFDVAQGIDYAVNYTDAQGRHPVKVINLSLGSPDDAQVLSDAVSRAFAAGIVVVAAAGNDNQPTVSYPAAYPNVIAVGATDFFKKRAYYSNYGPQISVVAPGGDIRSFDNNGDPDGILQVTLDPDQASQGVYDVFAAIYFEGTSSAAPHVSATAALLVTQGITDPTAVRRAMEETALDLGSPGRDDETGYGLVQPAAALAGLGLDQ